MLGRGPSGRASPLARSAAREPRAPPALTPGTGSVAPGRPGAGASRPPRSARSRPSRRPAASWRWGRSPRWPTSAGRCSPPGADRGGGGDPAGSRPAVQAPRPLPPRATGTTSPRCAPASRPRERAPPHVIPGGHVRAVGQQQFHQALVPVLRGPEERGPAAGVLRRGQEASPSARRGRAGGLGGCGRAGATCLLTAFLACCERRQWAVS